MIARTLTLLRDILADSALLMKSFYEELTKSAPLEASLRVCLWTLVAKSRAGIGPAGGARRTGWVARSVIAVLGDCAWMRGAWRCYS